jgi:hypothetical protein
VLLNRIFLQRDVEADVNRRFGLRGGDAVSTDKRGGDALYIMRLVVPLDIVPDLIPLHQGRVNPVDPGTAHCRVQRTGTAQNNDRDAIAPGIENGHAGMLKADDIVGDGGHGFPLGLPIAMGDRYGNLFVAAKDYLGFHIAGIIDNRIVNTSKGGTGIECRVLDVETRHQVDNQVRTILRFSLFRRVLRFVHFISSFQ